GCLGCHNSGYSVSGAQTGWKRTHPIQGSFERSLYGAAYGIELPRAHPLPQPCHLLPQGERTEETGEPSLRVRNPL
ncbi:MAG: hypothetical protein AAB339_00030, partial [Elusimicrobiota bacterium]